MKYKCIVEYDYKEEAITELNTFKIGAKSEIGKNALNMAIQSLESWEEVINHLEATATELLERENEKQSHAFAKGITFAVAMIKNHMKEVEE